MAIILASQSPRRKELLKRIVSDFDILPANINEEVVLGQSPVEYVKSMAKEKALVVSKDYPQALVIGCDTIVSIDQEILGKPVSKEEAKNMLKQLSGRAHDVYTSVCLSKGEQQLQETIASKVVFYSLTQTEMNHYLETDEYQDKAGAYGIQEKGALFVKEIIGDYYAIMGLPIAAVYRMIQKIDCSQ